MNEQSYVKVVSVFSVLLLVATYVPGVPAYAAIDITINGVPVVSDVNEMVSGIVSRTVSSSSSGGEVSASGSVRGGEDAAATVRSIIRGDGTNVRAYIDVRTEQNDEVQSQSVERVLEAGERLEVRLLEGAVASATAEVEADAEEPAEESALPTLFARFYDAVSRMAATIFFLW